MRSYKYIYLITLLSGAAGLVYEIAWTRMLVLIFGSTTHSIIAVISAFLGGLAIGSFIIGRWCDQKEPTWLIKAYSFIEFAIGVSAALTLLVLPLIHQSYAFLSDGASLTSGVLIIKFLLTLIVLLLPTILMGGTLPILAALLRYRGLRIDDNVSLLYGLNTLGAVFGVIIAAFISIELLGLRGTIFVGVALNLLAGTLMRLVNKENFTRRKEVSGDTISCFNLPLRERLILFFLFISGLISIAYEILWTRALIPVTGTFIYAFAFILIVYLIGITSGSLMYNRLLAQASYRNLFFGMSQLGIGFFSLGSIFIISKYISGVFLLPLLVVLPASICMGISFPAALSLFGKEIHHGRVVGISYFSNTFGSILGGILASFLLIPFIGSMQSIVLLVIGNFLLAFSLFVLETKKSSSFQRLFLLYAIIPLIAFILWTFLFKRSDIHDSTTKKWIAEAAKYKAQFIHREDDVASVIGMQDKEDQISALFIDGIEITVKVIETRLMAYLPIALHNGSPDSILIVGLGMGATLNSALLYGIEADAVELSPSVANMYTLFYPDAKSLLEKNGGEIIINDGRNYVRLTNKKYDVVTIDPPPPFNSAGTTVLYSEGFYKDMLHILKPDSIIMQWVPSAPRIDDNLMVTKSFINIFPYVIGIKSPGYENGLFLIGSLSPIVINEERINELFSSKVVNDDLEKFNLKINAGSILPLVISKNFLIELTRDVLPVTDNHPRTEYFLLRHFFTAAPE